MSDTKPSAPESWEKLLATKGLSQSRLADEAGVAKSTVNRMVRGMGRPDADSVRKIAAVLTDGETDAIWRLVGTGHADYGDFPLASIEDDLRLLTPKQRTALISIVRSMSDPEGKRLGDVASAAEKRLSAVPDGPPADDGITEVEAARPDDDESDDGEGPSNQSEKP